MNRTCGTCEWRSIESGDCFYSKKFIKEDEKSCDKFNERKPIDFYCMKKGHVKSKSYDEAALICKCRSCSKYKDAICYGIRLGKKLTKTEPVETKVEPVETKGSTVDPVEIKTDPVLIALQEIIDNPVETPKMKNIRFIEKYGEAIAIAFSMGNSPYVISQKLKEIGVKLSRNSIKKFIATCDES